MRRLRRSAVVAALLLGVALLVVPGAQGHGGALLASVQAGPFRTSVSASRVLEKGHPAVDYTVYVNEVSSARPITDADVRIRARTPDGRTLDPTVRRVGGGYEAVVETHDVTDPRANRLRVAIATPQGRGLVQIAPTATDSGPPAALIPVSIVGLLAGLALVLVVRRRRREHDASSEEAAS